MVRFTWMVCLWAAHVNDHVARTGTRAGHDLIHRWCCGGLVLPEFRLDCHPLDLNEPVRVSAHEWLARAARL